MQVATMMSIKLTSPSWRGLMGSDSKKDLSLTSAFSLDFAEFFLANSSPLALLSVLSSPYLLGLCLSLAWLATF
jgi:hypothetical protein